MDTFSYTFFKIAVSSALSLRLLFLPHSPSFKITDYNEKLVVSYKSLSLKGTLMQTWKSAWDAIKCCLNRGYALQN